MIDYKSIAVAVLEVQEEWLTVLEITNLALSSGLIPSDGKGSNEKVEAAFASVLYTDLCRKQKMAFSFKPDRDVFGLAKWEENEDKLNESKSGSSSKRKRVRKAEPTMANRVYTELEMKDFFKQARGQAPLEQANHHPIPSQRLEQPPVVELTGLPQGLRGSLKETFEKPTQARQRKRKAQSDLMLTAEISQISDVAKKLGENNVLVGKMWLELSQKLKPADLLLAEFALKKATKVLQKHKEMERALEGKKDKKEELETNKTAEVGPSTAAAAGRSGGAGVSNSNPSSTEEGELKNGGSMVFDAKQVIEQTIAVAEQPYLLTPEQAERVGRDMVKAASGGSQGSPGPTTLQNLALLQYTLSGILARSTMSACPQTLGGWPMVPHAMPMPACGLNPEGLARQQLLPATLQANPAAIHAAAAMQRMVSTSQGLQGPRPIASSAADQQHNMSMAMAAAVGAITPIQTNRPAEPTLPKEVPKLQLEKLPFSRSLLYDLEVSLESRGTGRGGGEYKDKLVRLHDQAVADDKAQERVVS